MAGGCTCSSRWSWEHGPCDYCTSDYCPECEHDSEECPEDCICDCNDNEEDDDD